MQSSESQPAPLHDLSAFQRDALVVIRDLDEPHGLGIKAKLEEVYGEQEINHGRLYPNLDDLVEKGLVEKGSLDDRTNSYTLTRRGRRELGADAEWRQNGGI